jgi:thioredoxin reductase (NADPH)
VIETDALVIGAGPVGLFTVFQLGLQGIQAQVVDVLDAPGGQCAALYPDKPIYDIPGIPVCSGRELVDRLLQQIAPFSTGFHWNQQVSTLEPHRDGRWLVSTERNHQVCEQFLARTVVVAAGVGAFVPKELKQEGLGAFLGQQLFYKVPPPQLVTGKNLVIVGGEDEAVAQAIAQAHSGQARSVTLLYRRDVLQASEAALAEFNTLQTAGRIQFLVGQVTGIETSQQQLTGLTVSTPEDQTLNLALDLLLVCQGISPKLGPVAQWGLTMERKQLTVDTATFATNAPGIFAVGDVITYPGKKKLIVCGFHEATLAAFAAAALVHPEASTVLQYTTSSALLQQRLGVLPTP